MSTIGLSTHVISAAVSTESGRNRLNRVCSTNGILCHSGLVGHAGDSLMARTRQRLSPEVVVGVVFVSSMFMTIMDITVVNVAIPTIAREFHAPISSVQWVATGYLLSLAMWIPASGWIGDRFGVKRVLLAAIAVFTLGSASCAAG